MVQLHCSKCMLAVCRAAMLTDEKCLSVDLPLPKCLSESFGLGHSSRGMEHAQEVGNNFDRAFLKDWVFAVIRPNELLVSKAVQLLHTLPLLVESDLSAKVVIFWHGRVCPRFFIVMRSPDGCRKLRHRHFKQTHKVSFSSPCPWRLSGNTICFVRVRPLL